MTLDTTEIVATTLEAQAVKADELARSAERASAGHQGARDTIRSVEDGLKGITPQAETEIMADEELDDEAKVLALRYVSRSMMRVAQALHSARENQANMVFLKQGEGKAMRGQAAMLRKQAEIRRAQVRATEESVAMGEENKAKAAAKAKPKPKKGTNGAAKAKRKRKSRAKPKAPGADAN